MTLWKNAYVLNVHILQICFHVKAYTLYTRKVLKHRCNAIKNGCYCVWWRTRGYVGEKTVATCSCMYPDLALLYVKCHNHWYSMCSLQCSSPTIGTCFNSVSVSVDAVWFTRGLPFSIHSSSPRLSYPPLDHHPAHTPYHCLCIVSEPSLPPSLPPTLPFSLFPIKHVYILTVAS